MERNIVQQNHYGALVWAHVEMDELRRTECLCRLCDRLRPGQPDNCPTAEKFYQICKSDNAAMSVTRCPIFVTRGSEKIQ